MPLNPEISLCFCTLGRTQEPIQFLTSIKSQLKDIQVICVDQNQNDIWSVGSDLKSQIDYFRVSFKGLSRARNFALQKISGAIVGFPDDDGFYREDTLTEVSDFFQRHPTAAAVIGECIDLDGQYLFGFFENLERKLNAYEILKYSASIVFFVRADILRNIGNFDIHLGVGADSVFQAGEETDLALRIFEKGSEVWGSSKIRAIHPQRKSMQSWADYRREIFSSAGFSFVIKKHFGVVIALASVFSAAFKIILGILKLNPRLAWRQSLATSGRFLGILYRPKSS